MSPSFFKRGGAAAVHFGTATKQEINGYVQTLSGQGYQLYGTPIEYRQAMSQQQLRESARDYAYQSGCHLVIEVNDPNPMANPFNPYKFYLFQWTRGGQAPEPLGPPSKTGGGAAQAGRTFAQFTCPYCRNVFTSYVNPGRNVLTCTSCRGQSMVEVPAPGAAQFGGQTGSANVQAEMAKIKLRGRYNTLDEMAMDCLEVLGKMLMIDGNPLNFDDTGEFLYPFIKIKSGAYEHIGFRKMDMILLKEAIHDYRIIGSEQHSQSQSNVNPHKDEHFSLKILGGINFLILEEFKALEPDQKQSIINAFYQFLTQYVGVMQ
ncbi:MAG: hypothetical protein ACMUIE_08585 [Thermoplasmatota archaeon]